MDGFLCEMPFKGRFSETNNKRNSVESVDSVLKLIFVTFNYHLFSHAPAFIVQVRKDHFSAIAEKKSKLLLACFSFYIFAEVVIHEGLTWHACC